MIKGKGKIELFKTDTGEILFENEVSNVILDQAILGFCNQPGGLTWPDTNNNQGDWLIAVGTGYVNPPERYTITQLDNYLATSKSAQTVYTMPQPSGTSFTVSAEFSPEELLSASGGATLLTEAGLILNGVPSNLWNRLMFKSTPGLTGSSYKYYIRTMFNGPNGPVFSASSNPVTVSNPNILNSAGAPKPYSSRLDWTSNGHVTSYYIFRIDSSGNEGLHITNNSFFIDTGLDNAVFTTITSSYEAGLPLDPTILAPTINTGSVITGTIDLAPYPVPKTNAFGCRISITISFTIPSLSP